MGITEKDFWEMTIAELGRLMESKKRAMDGEIKQRALMDYKLADLIGKSLARVYSDSAKMPEFKEFYSFLFTEEDRKNIEEERQAKNKEISAIRFRQFAESFNAKFKEVAKD